MNRLLLLIATITLAGCARPGDHPISSNCVWTEPDIHPLQLTRISDRRHLRFDAVTAEDMAIRWSDIHFGLRPEWDQKCYECMQTLFQGIGWWSCVHRNRKYSTEQCTPELQDEPHSLQTALGHAVCLWLCCLLVSRVDAPADGTTPGSLATAARLKQNAPTFQAQPSCPDRRQRDPLHEQW